MFLKTAINIAGDYFVGFRGQLKSGSTSIKASVDRFLYLRTVLFENSLWSGDLWLAAASSCTLSDIPLCRLTMSPQTQRPLGQELYGYYVAVVSVVWCNIWRESMARPAQCRGRIRYSDGSEACSYHLALLSLRYVFLKLWTGA